MKLVEPSLEMEKEYWEFVKEFIKQNEKFIPHAISPVGKNYREWFENNCRNSDEITCPKNLVPSKLYFLQSDSKKILGAVHVRVRLNDYLSKYGGHIGYSIAPSERKKGYGERILKLALEESYKLEIEKILITCNKKNIASSKIITANGGVLENEVYDNEGQIIQRYWVNS